MKFMSRKITSGCLVWLLIIALTAPHIYAQGRGHIIGIISSAIATETNATPKEMEQIIAIVAQELNLSESEINQLAASVSLQVGKQIKVTKADVEKAAKSGDGKPVYSEEVEAIAESILEDLPDLSLPDPADVTSSPTR